MADNKLNPQILNKESPLAKSKVVSAMDFDSQNERGAVTAMHIRNFSFSQGSGGTLVLGGPDNGDGIMVVRDATSSQGVIINNSGIYILNGNIVILNSSGGTIVDANGLVSTANFSNAFIFNDDNGTTTSTSYQAVAGASLGPFVLSRDTNVYSFLSIYGQNSNFWQGMSARFQGSDSVDGQLFAFPLFQTYAINSINFSGSNWSSAETCQLGAVSSINTLSAGTHTISANFRCEEAGGTAIYEAFYFGYIILGA